MIFKLIRILLFPISIIYGFITFIRNKFYDNGILRSTSFNLSIICIGNLSVGGTGKTPHTEYITRLLKDNFKLAILSRGYGRKSKGYILANDIVNSNDIGDEPMQFYTKFGKEVSVSVCESRVEGVQNLIKDINPEIVVLDDAYQHRAIKAGLYVLLSSYNDLFFDDYLLPTGNLREYRRGVNRANIIVVTKSPVNLSQSEKEIVTKKMRKYTDAEIYFSTIVYDNNIFGKKMLRLDFIKDQEVVLLTGIANPKSMIEYLKGRLTITEHLSYDDHYNFTEKDIEIIKKKSNDRLILTTEKDYMRLKQFDGIYHQLYYLPIKIKIDRHEHFDNNILNFINHF